MVSFELGDVGRNVRDLVHWLAETKVRPVCIEADRTGRYPDSLYRDLQAMGLAQGLSTAASREASMAKAYAAQVAMRTCSNALQLMGPRAAERGSSVEKLFRDVKVFDIFEGTGQVPRIIISRRIFEQLTS